MNRTLAQHGTLWGIAPKTSLCPSHPWFGTLCLSVSLWFVSLAANGLAAEPEAPPTGFVGDWALRMADGQAGWLRITRDEDGAWGGELWTVGQPRAISDMRGEGAGLTFTRRVRIGLPDYPGGPATGKPVDCRFVAGLDRDVLRIVRQTALPAVHIGTRLPPMPPRPDLSEVTFGRRESLFNGKNLDGWVLSNDEQENGWRAENGELVNETPKKTFDPFSRYGNLRTKKSFGDGRLTIEFNVPKGGNSGIYVRGAYEAQVVDRDSRMQGIQGVGAIFGRVAPVKNAGKPGGEWQRYEITLVDRHATVVLNGETVIDNQPVVGNTNGAFQADITKPGPLYLQGDHTSVRYRNITFEPVVEPERKRESN